jgi:hypothetical protein
MTAAGSRSSPSLIPTAPPPPVSLVYIAGAHRSGATPLGAVLAGHPSIFFGGEMYRFPYPIFGHPDPTRLCSCGEPVDTCPLWSRIRTELESEPGTLDALRRGQLHFERWRRLPQTLWRQYRRDPELLRHVERMGRFVRILAEATGAPTIVESSYNPLRGRLYQDPASGVDVCFLHLVRDGRNFIASERLAVFAPESPWKWLRARPVIVIRWVAYHALSVVLLRHAHRYLRVSYEELLRDPDRNLRVISGEIGIDLSSVIHQVEIGAPIPMRHIAAGNRVRLQGELRLASESAAIPPLDFTARTLFWGLGGWLALLLGYRPGSVPSPVHPTNHPASSGAPDRGSGTESGGRL